MTEATLDPVALLGAVADRIAARIIVPGATYTPEEAARLLCLGDRKRIYEVPEAELRRRRAGPNRGRVVFLGVDLLNYLEGKPPEP